MSSLPLTFGLEFEYLLAFHESSLPQDAHIVKYIPSETRIALRQVTDRYSLDRPQYHGWALASPSDYPSPFGPTWRTDCYNKHGYRGYADEILSLEAALLKEKNCDVAVHHGNGKIKDFNRWVLMNDTSLVSATREDLAEVLGHDDGHWDSAPVELVSRILSVDDKDSFVEIDKFLNILKGDGVAKGYQAFTDQWCGLHVHIGLPSSSPSQQSPIFSLALLQHLAYITLIYEPLLSTLHPPTRRPPHPNSSLDLASNRSAFYEEPDYSQVDWDDLSDSGYASDESRCGSFDLANLSRRNSREENTERHTQSPTNEADEFTTTQQEREAQEDLNDELRLRRRARRLLFFSAAEDGKVMSIMELARLMNEGNKSRIINWMYLTRHEDGREGGRTVEFRQHEGCLDGREVRMWVQFCAGLVRWAERVAGEWEARDAGGMEEEEEWFEDVYGRGRVGVEELMRGMGAGRQMREWVKGRIWLSGGD
ncbi:MAG: hypothetical protein Q9220_001760 [cf. Caloplaca sp. 1 TL-2023]